MATPTKHILKFGGSSLKTTALIQQCIQVVIDRMSTAQPVVVVSAIGGVTDTLINITDNIADDSDLVSEEIQKLEQLHNKLFIEVISADHPKRGDLQNLFGELRNTIRDQHLRDNNRPAWKDRVLSFGERASAIIFAAALSQHDIAANNYEANHFIKTDSNFGEANVEPVLTQSLIEKFISASELVPVITGFIASNSNGNITTLGRSGSDYTASLIANALNADHLEIWTDVDGVLSADPRWVPNAHSIDHLSFTDIHELAVHGANVIHPQTINPIRDTNTTVRVKNSYNPKHPGTLITSKCNSNGNLKTITVKGPFVSLQLEPSHAKKLLTKIEQWQQEISDSYSIGFKQSSNVEPARFLIPQPLFDEIANQLASWAKDQNLIFDLTDDLYQVKKFSNHFQDGKTTERIWQLLNDHNLRPLNNEHNLDERFISFLFQEEDARQAARLMDSYLQESQPIIDLFIAGTGAVGHTLLQKLSTITPNNFRFRLLGFCNSSNAVWNNNGVSLQEEIDWSDSQATDWPTLLENLTQANRHNLIFVDATGSEEVARLYPQLLESGANIVTPSKLANTFEQSFFDKLQSLVVQHNSSFRYETTVGAGLPVISTLNDLCSSGDQITEISGVVSGTMTYLFNQLEKGIPFSKAIIDARKKGYAEPDPRDDLSGEDVARKFLTLARTIGLKIERHELKVESLIPKELQEVDQHTFLEKLSDYDSDWQQRIQNAQKRNKTLRYTGQLKGGKINIGIQAVSKNSPLGQLTGTDNLIQIFSELYEPTPLIIQGAGAGKEVTAAGVLSDILKVATKLTE